MNKATKLSALRKFYGTVAAVSLLFIPFWIFLFLATVSAGGGGINATSDGLFVIQIGTFSALGLLFTKIPWLLLLFAASGYFVPKPAVNLICTVALSFFGMYILARFYWPNHPGYFSAIGMLPIAFPISAFTALIALNRDAMKRGEIQSNVPGDRTAELFDSATEQQ